MKKNGIQLENGYTKIANDLLDGIMFCGMKKNELLVVLAIMRKTYGWNRKTDKISYSQFTSMTNLDRKALIVAVKNLLELNLIGRAEAGRFKYGKPVYKYWIEKNSMCQNNTYTSVKTTHITSVKTTHTKEKKEILKKGRKTLVDKLDMKKIYLTRKKAIKN